MKKTLCVFALAVVLLIAFSGVAFAVGIDHSGQDQAGAHDPVTPLTDPRTLPPGAWETAVSQGAIYEAWDPNLAGNVGSNSPHGNYTTTTVKCVVCHAVHYAAPGMAPVGDADQQADTLLRMKASEACIMCHATAGMAVNGRPVYDGLGPVALDGPGLTGGATNTGHIIGTNCSYCHTNVHGANADQSVAALDGYLLKKMTATNVQNTGATTTNMIEAVTTIDHNAVNQGWAAGEALGFTIGEFATSNTDDVREQAVGVFCAECHLGSYAQNAAGASTNVLQEDPASVPANSIEYSGHRVGAASSHEPVVATADWNADGSKSSGLVKGMQVAWAPASTCKSCHDADDVYGNDAFPHSWGGTKMWLTSAADAGAPVETLPYGTAAGSAYDAGQPQLSDGVCLKCHVASGGANGVGIDF